MTYPYAARRPGAPKVMGVLAIVFGGLTLLINGVMVANGMFAGNIAGEGVAVNDLAGLDEGLAADLRVLQVVSVGQHLIFILMSIALVAIGIGSVQYRRWASKAARIWSTLALILLAAIVVSMLTVMLGPMDRTLQFIADQSGDRIPEGFGRAFMIFAALITAALYAPFPIIMAVQYGKERNIDAMTE